MPGKPKRTKVFVSYSRQDKTWLDRLSVHLKPLQRELDIDVWDDSVIQPGKKWKDQITNAINSTKVAVLGYYGDENSFVDLLQAGVMVPVRNVVDLLGATVKIAARKLASSRYTDELVRQLSAS